MADEFSAGGAEPKTQDAETAFDHDNRGTAQETTGADGAGGVASARDRFQRELQNRYERVSEDVRRGAERASGEIRRGAERAKETYGVAAERAKEKYGVAAERARETYGVAAERARENFGGVAENARQSYEKVRTDAGRLTREAGFYVRDNPGKAVLMAAGVGFLLGLIARRTQDDDDDI